MIRSLRLLTSSALSSLAIAVVVVSIFFTAAGVAYAISLAPQCGDKDDLQRTCDTEGYEECPEDDDGTQEVCSYVLIQQPGKPAQSNCFCAIPL